MITTGLRDVLLEAIDRVATEFIFLTDATAVEDGGPFIVYVNDAMLREFGYTASELIGKSPNIFWGPETDVCAVTQLRRTIDAFREAGGEFAVYRKDGSKLWVRFRGRALQIHGEPSYWIAVGSNVTEYRHRCEEIAELSCFRSDLIAMLAHDFRGPLAAISGFAELLLDENAVPDPQQAELVRVIRREAQRLATFAADTVAVSELESDTLRIVPERFDVVPVLHEVADLYTGRGEIAVHAPASLELRGDPARLRQAVENLIGNAVKYSPHNSPVRVDVAIENGKTALIAVSDRGIGVPPGEIRAIFGRHQRGSNARISKDSNLIDVVRGDFTGEESFQRF